METERPKENEHAEHRAYPKPAEVFKTVIRIQQKLAVILATLNKGNDQ